MAVFVCVTVKFFSTSLHLVNEVPHFLPQAEFSSRGGGSYQETNKILSSVAAFYYPGYHYTETAFNDVFSSLKSRWGEKKKVKLHKEEKQVPELPIWLGFYVHSSVLFSSKTALLTKALCLSNYICEVKCTSQHVDVAYNKTVSPHKILHLQRPCPRF